MPLVIESDGLALQAQLTRPPLRSGVALPGVVLCHGFPELAYSWRHQVGAVAAVARRLVLNKGPLKDGFDRPDGVLLFLGPTGVGKTLLAKALAKFMFDHEEALMQIDMSEYMEKHNVSRLVGAPPGYVGFEEGGQLTEKIRRRPYAVVLFDEIEKAHHDVFNVLLQVLDDGRLTDGQGRTVDFRNTVIIMTSNVGARVIEKATPLGFQRSESGIVYENIKDNVLGELRKTFNPEFLNRVDEIVVFHPLEKKHLISIVDLLIEELNVQLIEQDLVVEVSQDVKEWILDQYYKPAYGARPMRRAVQRVIEDPLAEEILKGRFKGSNRVRVLFEAGSPVFVADEEASVLSGVS